MAGLGAVRALMSVTQVTQRAVRRFANRVVDQRWSKSDFVQRNTFVTTPFLSGNLSSNNRISRNFPTTDMGFSENYCSFVSLITVPTARSLDADCSVLNEGTLSNAFLGLSYAIARADPSCNSPAHFSNFSTNALRLGAC